MAKLSFSLFLCSVQCTLNLKNKNSYNHILDDELKVRPGTPLNMDIYLDSVSSSVYGILGQYISQPNLNPTF